MTKIILDTYVKYNKPPPEHTRPSLNKKEVSLIRTSRKEALLQILNELEKQQLVVQTDDMLKKMREYILDRIEKENT